jgi:hypothetical protein
MMQVDLKFIQYMKINKYQIIWNIITSFPISHNYILNKPNLFYSFSINTNNNS